MKPVIVKICNELGSINDAATGNLRWKCDKFFMEVEMEIELSHLRGFLKEEFEKRQAFKPLYSMRAFSRDMGLSATSLNSFMAGKRDLSLQNIDKIFKYLKKQSSIACSWCGNTKRNTKILIGGPRSQYICKDCVDTCNEIIRTGKMRSQ